MKKKKSPIGLKHLIISLLINLVLLYFFVSTEGLGVWEQVWFELLLTSTISISGLLFAVCILQYKPRKRIYKY
jgi:uncharacterized membrane protein